jgi:pimeloyl-ACP methyl ester carboxylesterase
MLRRRALLTAAAALPLASCTTGPKWNGFRYFARGNPKDTPLVVAPVGPKGLEELLSERTIAGFVAAGFYVVGVHWPGMDGGPEDYGARQRDIAGWLRSMKLERPLLFAQSRGGLQLLNFACDHPDAFSKIAALYPVTDPFVYPGAGPELWKAYGVTEVTFPVHDFTPNARAEALRDREVKIWHGDSDKVVPKRLTSDVFAAKCGAELVTLPGVGHDRIWLDDIPVWLKATHRPSPA